MRDTQSSLVPFYCSLCHRLHMRHPAAKFVVVSLNQHLHWDRHLLTQGLQNGDGTSDMRRVVFPFWLLSFPSSFRAVGAWIAAFCLGEPIKPALELGDCSAERHAAHTTTARQAQQIRTNRLVGSRKAIRRWHMAMACRQELTSSVFAISPSSAAIRPLFRACDSSWPSDRSSSPSAVGSPA